MDNAKKQLKGSETRDRFKQLHKAMLPAHCYALDSDLELVEKLPFPFIVARIDFKVEGDQLTFAEAISYDYLLNGLPSEYRIPVFIIEATRAFRVSEDPSDHRFTVWEIIEVDYKPEPPLRKANKLLSGLTWRELAEWEIRLREARRAEMLLKVRGNL